MPVGSHVAAECLQTAGENFCQGGLAHPGGAEQPVEPGGFQLKGQALEDKAVRLGILESDVTALEGHAHCRMGNASVPDIAPGTGTVLV